MYISISILGQLTNYSIFVGFVVLTAVTVRSTIFWDVTPCDPAKFTDFSEERNGPTFRTEDQAWLLQDYMAHSKLSVCCLFTDVVSISGYTASNDCVTVNNELDGMWKEAVVAWLRYYPRIYLWWLKKAMAHLSQCNQVSRPRFYPSTSKYKSEALLRFTGFFGLFHRPVF
jgi:hypothetical protein